MPEAPDREPESTHDVLTHYGRYEESSRLAVAAGPLELARTQEIVTRFLPHAPGVVLDIGGGPGIYADWLAGLGHEVHLVDPVAHHVQQARERSAARPEHGLASAEVGDARDLRFADSSASAVLMLGPLYHLVEDGQRMQALHEARRVLHEGGVLFAAGISRYASVLDGLSRDLLSDPVFAGIVERDLEDGQHRNPTGNPDYFTTAYFHRPEDLLAEIAAAGFHDAVLLGIEGPAWLLPDLEQRWSDAARREQLLAALRRLEGEPSVVGTSAHLLVVARK